jgi:hypothetical protein
MLELFEEDLCREWKGVRKRVVQKRGIAVTEAEATLMKKAEDH